MSHSVLVTEYLRAVATTRGEAFSALRILAQNLHVDATRACTRAVTALRTEWDQIRTWAAGQIQLQIARLQCSSEELRSVLRKAGAAV